MRLGTFLLHPRTVELALRVKGSCENSLLHNLHPTSSVDQTCSTIVDTLPPFPVVRIPPPLRSLPAPRHAPPCGGIVSNGGCSPPSRALRRRMVPPPPARETANASGAQVGAPSCKRCARGMTFFTPSSKNLDYVHRRNAHSTFIITYHRRESEDSMSACCSGMGTKAPKRKCVANHQARRKELSSLYAASQVLSTITTGSTLPDSVLTLLNGYEHPTTGQVARLA